MTTYPTGTIHHGETEMYREYKHNPYRCRPCQSTGYYTGGGSEIPLEGGQGSGIGPAHQGIDLPRQGQGISFAGPRKDHTLVLLGVVLAVGFACRVLA